MAQIYLDELKSVQSCSAFTNLSVDYNESKSINETIDMFNNDTKELEGDSWTQIKSKLGEYGELLKQRMQVASELSEAINEATKLLLDYLGEYDSLDSSKLEEVKQSKKQCEDDITKLEGCITATKTVTDPNTGVTSVVSAYSAAQIASFKSQIAQLKETIAELEKLINKLEGLDEIYAQAEAILKEAFSKIETFGSGAKSITPSQKVVYTPAS